MYLKVEANINQMIEAYKGTAHDLIALQLEAIKDTGHTKEFERDFSNLILEVGDEAEFSLVTLREWLVARGFTDTLELILKRIKEDLYNT